LYEKSGRFSTTYIKDSFVTRIYYNNNKIITRREIFRPDSLKIYIIEEKRDTMYSIDITSSYYFSNRSLERITGKKIAGTDCIGVKMINNVQTHISSEPYTTTFNYYFDTTRKLYPEMYKRVKYGSFDKAFKDLMFVTLGYEQEDVYGKITGTATRVLETDINPLYFSVPQNKVEVNPYLQ
jgi:hypothetical protein